MVAVRVDGQSPSVELRDGAGRGQAETRAGTGAVSGRVEELEDPLSLGRRDPRAFVVHAGHDLAALPLDPDGDDSAVRHGLESVREEMDEETLEPGRVPGNQPGPVDELFRHFDGARPARAEHKVSGGPRRVLECHRRSVAAALAGETVDALDDRLDVLCAPLDELQALESLGSGLGVPKEEVDEREDREERIVDLVGRARGQLAESRHPAALDQRLNTGVVAHVVFVGREPAASHHPSGVLLVTRIGDGYDWTLDVSQVPERLEGTMTDRQVSVLLVEDDAIVRAWVRLALEPSPLRLIGEAASMGEGLELARRRRPELLLVDYRLPDGSGTELVRRLRDEGIEVPAVLMTAGPERGLNEAAREAGAQGTVLKTDRGEELLATLLAALDGAEPFDPQHPRRGPGRAPLTPRERDVLRLVAAGATNAEIADQLGVGEETVKTLLSRVFLKLGVRRRAEAVSVAQRAGLL